MATAAWFSGATRLDRSGLSADRHRRRGAAGPSGDGPRQGGNAGVHAGRHGGDGESDDAGDGCRHRSAHRPRQHLSPDAAARSRTGAAFGRAAPVHELAGTDPHRFRRISGDVACTTPQGQRRRCPVPIPCGRQRPYADAGTLGGYSADARRRHLHGLRRMHALSGGARRRRRVHAALHALGASAPMRRSTRGTAMACSVSSREASTPICGRSRWRRCWISASTATPWAASPSARGRKPCSRCWTATNPRLPPDRPRYLMGVGKPDDLVGAVARGIDMFDCVLPTRSGRTGQAFTRYGPVNIRNARHMDDPRPLDETLDCPASRDFSRAYLHHLVRSRGNSRRHAAHVAQYILLSGSDARHAGRHRSRPVPGVRRRVRRRSGTRRH